jgi:hypothetical protein
MWYVKKEYVKELSETKDFNGFLDRMRELLEEDKAFSAPLTHVARKPLHSVESFSLKALEAGYEPVFLETEYM